MLEMSEDCLRRVYEGCDRLEGEDGGCGTHRAESVHRILCQCDIRYSITIREECTELE